MASYNPKFIQIKLHRKDISLIAELVANKIKQDEIGQPRTYQVKEVASILDVHSNTVKNYIKKGILEASKNGRRYVITEKELNKFLKQ